MRFPSFGVPASVLSLALSLALAVAGAACAHASNHQIGNCDTSDGQSMTCNGCTFLYASTNANRILVYKISSTGGLGSPLSTLAGPDISQLGGSGFGAPLYVLDARSNAVDEYIVNYLDGALSRVPCSALSLGTAPGAAAGLAFARAGRTSYLYVGDTNGSISGFNIGNPMGSITTAVPGSPFAAGAAPVNLLAPYSNPPNLPVLYAADHTKDVIWAFTIAADGGLTAISGSPFSTLPNSAPAGMAWGQTQCYVGEAQCQRILYVALSGTNQIAAFSIAASGALSPVPGSPFASGRGPQSLLFYPANPNDFLYALNGLDHTISAYIVDRISGALRPAQGSPFAAGTASAGIVSGQTFPVPTPRIYVPDLQSKSILAFAVDPATGSLSQLPGSPFPTGAGPKALTAISTPFMSVEPEPPPPQ